MGDDRGKVLSTRVRMTADRGREDRNQVSLNGDGSATRGKAPGAVPGVPIAAPHSVLPRQVTIDEPPEPRRIRRPPDLMRLLFETGLIIIVVLLAIPGSGTTTGLETDIHNSINLAPQLFLSTITLL